LKDGQGMEMQKCRNEERAFKMNRISEALAIRMEMQDTTKQELSVAFGTRVSAGR